MAKKYTGHGLKTRNYADQGALCQWGMAVEMMIGGRLSGGLGGLSLTFTGFLERP